MTAGAEPGARDLLHHAQHPVLPGVQSAGVAKVQAATRHDRLEIAVLGAWAHEAAG